jgi:hypothetical protein
MLVLLLGAFLALGMSLAAVQAGEMPSKMTMTSAMGASGHCSGCGDDGGTANKMVACSFGCVAPVLAVIPQTASTRVVQTAALLPRQDSLLFGRAPSPDPFPPRSADPA